MSEELLNDIKSIQTRKKQLTAEIETLNQTISNKEATLQFYILKGRGNRGEGLETEIEKARMQISAIKQALSTLSVKQSQLEKSLEPEKKVIAFQNAETAYKQYVDHNEVIREALEKTLQELVEQKQMSTAFWSAIRQAGPNTGSITSRMTVKNSKNSLMQSEIKKMLLLLKRS